VSGVDFATGYRPYISLRALFGVSKYLLGHQSGDNSTRTVAKTVWIVVYNFGIIVKLITAARKIIPRPKLEHYQENKMDTGSEKAVMGTPCYLS